MYTLLEVAASELDADAGRVACEVVDGDGGDDAVDGYEMLLSFVDVV